MSNRGDYFKSQLNQCDIVIKSNNNNNNNNNDIIFCDDSHKSLRSLEKAFRLQAMRVEDFIYGLEEYIENNLSSTIAPMQRNDR